MPDAIELVTLDLSYLSLARAVPELDRVQLAPDAELVALVKPMFELALAAAARRPRAARRRGRRRPRGVDDAGWDVLAVSESPTRGGRGAVEFLLHARHRASDHSDQVAAASPMSSDAERRRTPSLGRLRHHAERGVGRARAAMSSTTDSTTSASLTLSPIWPSAVGTPTTANAATSSSSVVALVSASQAARSRSPSASVSDE